MEEKKCPKCGAPCNIGVIMDETPQVVDADTHVFYVYKPPAGAVWVRASERLPEKDGYYCFRSNGGYMGAYLRTGANGNRWWCDSAGGTIRNWKNCEWLDESGTAAGREEDAVAFAEWIAINNWVLRNDKTTWHWGPIWVPKEEWIVCTSSELYIKFKQKEK